MEASSVKMFISHVLAAPAVDDRTFRFRGRSFLKVSIEALCRRHNPSRRFRGRSFMPSSHTIRDPLSFPLFWFQVWVQGIVVAIHEDRLEVDDGTGVIGCRVRPTNSSINPVSCDGIVTGSHVMVVGPLVAKDGYRYISSYHIVLLESEDHIEEAFWMVEVVDSWRNLRAATAVDAAKAALSTRAAEAAS